MTQFPALFDRLDIRLALVGLALLAIAFLAIVLVIVHNSRNAALEVLQGQNLALANYVATMQPRELIDIDGRADIALMRTLAEAVMKINPAVEVYLLNAQGRVVADALEHRAPIVAAIDLKPIIKLAIPSIQPPRLPIFGADPIRANREAIFSAAALGYGSTPDGYLYIVLDGRDAAASHASVATSTVRLVLISIGAIGLGLAIAFVWVLSRLTKPLRQLADRLHKLDQRTEPDPPIGGSREVRTLDVAIRSMQERVNAQFDALRVQDINRRELISGVSHDLRTPLTIACGHIESALVDGDTTNSAAQTSRLHQSLKQLRRLERRINDLFDLSRLNSEQAPLSRDRFVLAELVQDVLDGYRLAGGQRGITILFHPGQAPTTEIIADIALVERVLQNLLDNAFAYTPDGGRVRVSIDLSNTANAVRISVTNTGCGIEPQDLCRVFDRYWRSGSARSETESSGTGLGLAVVKSIVQRHQGQVGVDSKPGRETVFWIELAL